MRATFSSCCFASVLYEISSLASLQDDVNRKRGEDSSQLEAVTQCCSIKQTDNIGPSMKRRAVMVTFHRRGHLSSFCPTFVWLRGHAEIISHRMERHTAQQQAADTSVLHTAAAHSCHTLPPHISPAHCCYTLPLLHTAATHCCYTLPPHTAATHCADVQEINYTSYSTYIQTTFWPKDTTQGCTCIFKNVDMKKLFMEQTFMFTPKYKDL